MDLGKKGKKRIWWLPNYYFNPSEKQSDINNYSHGDFSVRSCPQCETAWEMGLIGKKRIPVYYDDFPLYKLKKITCPMCKEKDETD